MAELQEVMAYLCEHYPHKGELSKARLTKMIYLADWRMALTDKKQITNLSWVFNHYGPYLNAVPDEAIRNPRFDIRQDTNAYGSLKEVIRLREEPKNYKLTNEERQALDHVIEQTKPLTWQPFIKLVYSTYPIATQPRYETLNLVALAKAYKKQQRAVHSSR